MRHDERHLVCFIYTNRLLKKVLIMALQQPEKQEALKKLKELVGEVRVGMLATIGENGSLNSRPMQTIEVDPEGNLWFFTNEYSGKVEDVSKENAVYVMYSHPGKNTYLHIKGTATIVTDKAKMKELWSPVVKAWFPGGLEDPALSLLKVDTSEASYWDSSSSKFVVFFNMLKAISKGETPDEGEFGKLDVS
jgi:general stress protein 26